MIRQPDFADSIFPRRSFDDSYAKHVPSIRACSIYSTVVRGLIDGLQRQPVSVKYGCKGPQDPFVHSFAHTNSPAQTQRRLRRKRKQARPSAYLNTKIEGFGGLPNEIITTILHLLDPPGTVCLALSCHTNYYFILEIFDVKGLKLNVLCRKSSGYSGRRPIYPFQRWLNGDSD